MDIGEVAKETGLTPATLRYYEKFGLIHSIGRNGLRRVFAESVVKKLKLIILLKNNCFTLHEIKEMADRNQVDRQFISVKAEEISSRIQELTVVYNTLNHIVQYPEQDHFNCDSFEKLLNTQDA
ncbi:MerR family transcriptional regulator [Psychrobacter lutiphocae]|uniref:MerR family transcriptional regulator n=1 Tax=Psychrobacter lutiphocae TaxID=540500 RepID=UPI000376C179|nr:MerR family transcriptional regulator [Psychrobacter lutiphocae]